MGNPACFAGLSVFGCSRFLHFSCWFHISVISMVLHVSSHHIAKLVQKHQILLRWRPKLSPKRSPEVLVSVLLCCYAILPFLSIALPDPIWIKTIKTIKTIKSQTSKRCWTASAIEVSGHDLWHPPHPHHLPTKYCSKCQIGSWENGFKTSQDSGILLVDASGMQLSQS